MIEKILKNLNINPENFLTEVTEQKNKDELKKLLTNTKTNPLYRPAKVLFVEEIPKLGSVKIDFSATKKIALVNNQK